MGIVHPLLREYRGPGPLCFFLCALLMAGCGDKTVLSPASEPAGKLVVGAYLIPSPSDLDFSEVEEWIPTPIHIAVDNGAFDRVKMVLNPTGADPLIEIRSSQPNASTRTYCPPEQNDTKTVRTGSPFYLEACGSGTATLVITTVTNIPIDTLSFNVGDYVLPVLDEDWDPEFQIKLDYLSEFTDEQKVVAELAARRWESIIVEDIPDHSRFQSEPETYYDDN